MAVSDNIKRIREMHNLSQKELAEIAGVTDKAVSTWEVGTNIPRMGSVQRIADHFGILKSNIIEDGGIENIPPPPDFWIIDGKKIYLKDMPEEAREALMNQLRLIVKAYNL